jgi:hypothetical protein
VGHILWSEAAAAAMKRLDAGLQHAIRRRTEYLELAPRMYALAQDARYPGCRSFWVDGLCHIYYMVAAGGNDCYILAVEEAEPEEELGSAGGAGFDQEV